MYTIFYIIYILKIKIILFENYFAIYGLLQKYYILPIRIKILKIIFCRNYHYNKKIYQNKVLYFYRLQYRSKIGLRLVTDLRKLSSRCVGTVNGKYIMIQAPSNSGSEFYNYKDFRSIVLLSVVDFYYNFSLVDIGYNDGHNDSSIFLRSEITPYLEKQLHNILTQKLPRRRTPVP